MYNDYYFPFKTSIAKGRFGLGKRIHPRPTLPGRKYQTLIYRNCISTLPHFHIFTFSPYLSPTFSNYHIFKFSNCLSAFSHFHIFTLFQLSPKLRLQLVLFLA